MIPQWMKALHSSKLKKNRVQSPAKIELPALVAEVQYLPPAYDGPLEEVTVGTPDDPEATVTRVARSDT